MVNLFKIPPCNRRIFKQRTRNMGKKLEKKAPSDGAFRAYKRKVVMKQFRMERMRLIAYDYN